MAKTDELSQDVLHAHDDARRFPGLVRHARQEADWSVVDGLIAKQHALGGCGVTLASAAIYCGANVHTALGVIGAVVGGIMAIYLILKAARIVQ